MLDEDLSNELEIYRSTHWAIVIGCRRRFKITNWGECGWDLHLGTVCLCYIR